MKRAGALLLAAVLLLTLCACSRGTQSTVGPGRFNGEQICVYGGSWQPMDEVYSGETYLALHAGGEGVFCVDGEAAAVDWTAADGRLTLTMGSAHCEGTIDADTVTIGFFDADICMLFSKADSAAQRLPGSPPEQVQEKNADNAAADEAADYAAYWAGAWYGWHVITDTSEALRYLKDSAWDACARITVRADTGSIRVWDTENDPGELLCQAAVTFSPGATEAGRMEAASGTYLGCDITDGLLCDPGASEVQTFAHMICVSGRAEDEDGSWVRFRIYLRPWGMDWEDVRTGDTGGCLYRNMLPPGYDSWYAPLLAQGTTEMPDSFESAE